MTAVTSPARRRRHACLIAAAVGLVGQCAEAAAAIYRPIAEAPPTTGQVPVNLGVLAGLSASVPEQLDRAREEDDRRWPGDVARELAAGRESYARRRVVLEAEASLDGSAETPPAPGTISLDPGRLAALGPAGEGAELLEAVAGGQPEEVLALLRGLRAEEGYDAGEVLDDALNTALAAACFTVRDADRESNPSTAAERALLAARQFTTVVTLASLDWDEGHGDAAERGEA